MAHLRLARLSDLPTIGQVFATAFHDEEVVGPLLHPYRHQYPDDYLAYWRRRCCERYWDYGRVLVVSCEKDPSTGREVVVGVAEWERVGRLILPIIKTFNHIVSIWRPNRAAAVADPSDPFPLTPTTLQRTLWPFISHCYLSPPHRLTRWSLDCIAVHPDFEQRGHGRALVAWGLDRARKEGIPAGVMAAADKERFYQRCGLTEVAGWANDGVDDQGRVNPLKGRVRGGCILYTRVPEDDEWESMHPKRE
ncbi:hypothetical protein AYL99_01542 [Fonsecaea erecta]|uniref:N-acetyltransferase domain-containing protein n=1 Tax=Fonsecaea erecta TaxID=1367422 RepID=A0A179A096_9EURO|nr:hypothetical protein AYL99_01542 [Fonsecaea erecta]OAP65570.1 hypothetical protein AYL99_01542 [Fonsecaea erecta]